MSRSKIRHFDILVQECDADIRRGKPNHVARRLAQIGTSRIPREWRLPLAKICRRAGLYAQGLRLLGRLVSTLACTPSELAEYSALLIRSGAVGEALDKLRTIDVSQAPETLLIRAFAFFARWEYQEAIPDLENYLKTSLSTDAALVGRSNLALAYVETRQHEVARVHLEDNIRLAQNQGYSHLENYNRALLAQVCLQEGDLVAARKAIESSFREASQSQTYSDWSVVKLKLIIDGLENKDLKCFDELRRLAIEKKDWQTLRDADLFSLQIKFKEETFLHLYFGSPLPSFREQIRLETGRTVERKIYVLGQKTAPRFDLETGELDGRSKMRAGFKCHQLIKALLQDFYQPLRIGGLHAALFPGDHFDILSSPDRVHQIVRRTRRWLDESRIPVCIREDSGFYSLEIQGEFSFRVPLDRPLKELFHLQVEKLQQVYSKSQIFSAQEIQNELGISHASSYRLLKRAIESGAIEFLGNEKRPSGYRIPHPESKRRAA